MKVLVQPPGSILMSSYKLRRRRKKAVIIGLDGTPFSLLRALCEERKLPNFGDILRNGTFKPMCTALPEVSSVAWTSFMTGKNPGKHSIYGFTDLQPYSYSIYFPNYASTKSETLWDILGTYGKRSVVINLPSTYPARELNGAMISGFVAVDLEKAVYPQALVSKLNDIGYRIDIDLEKAQESKDYLLEDLNLTLEKREQTILELMDNEEWDLFIGVITETDRLHHFLWGEMENGNSSYREAFIDYYKKIDTFIGKIYDRIDNNTLFIILSDHGFCKVKKQVYLNYWLNQNGYLSYKTDSPKLIADLDGTRTKAFCLDPGRIYINLENRFPKGLVKESNYTAFREELKEVLSNLKLSNSSGEEAVIKQIYTKEEIYQGPYLDRAPDLVVLPQLGWDLKGSVSKGVLTDNGPWTGMHTFDNAFLFISEQVADNNFRIFDAMPTALSYLEVVVPSDVDGQGLLDQKT